MSRRKIDDEMLKDGVSMLYSSLALLAGHIQGKADPATFDKMIELGARGIESIDRALRDSEEESLIEG